MEAFTLLKYLKPTEATPQPQPLPPPIEEEDTDYIETTTDEEDDDEPFFDIEFAVPDEEEEQEQEEEPNESENELGFTLSPLTNEQLQLELNSSEPNSKPQFTASFLKSATKLRVFMSGALNKSKSSDTTAQKPESQKKKLFTVKFKVDEVPFVSFFTRDNSSKGKTSDTDDKASHKHKKQHNTEEEEEPKLHSPSSASSDEKLRFSKEVMQKYLKKVKPLYVKVSRKYAEKLKFSSSQLNSLPVKKPPAEKVRTENEGNKNNVKSQKQGSLPLPAGLRVVCKHLGKSRSGSLATEVAAVSSKRRDDSTVQQQDGIQSAILHCKSSFNASKECDPLKFESSRKHGNALEDEGGFLK
ncbi:probable membrane-associated kinase regulator 2 [Vicia villosa]|uniref:probable membrane-associated kinase regulator 2 n=1 Tax=Vicia villosa TaxID=3911 RepID=UPI00273B422D|nr:probable membrane-associated kinase regulator 2 [Vicia villosa]